MGDEYSLERPRRDREELASGLTEASERYHERAKERREQFFAEIAPQDGRQKLDGKVGELFAAYLFTELVEKPKTDNLREAIEEGAELEFNDAIPDKAQKKLSEVLHKASGDEGGELDGDGVNFLSDSEQLELIETTFKYSEGSQEWPHPPGAELHLKAESATEEVLRRGIIDTVTDIIDTGQFSLHSVEVVSEIALEAPGEVVTVISDIEKALYQFSRGSITNEAGVHACVQYFLGISKEYPGTIAKDNPDVVERLFEIAFASETHEWTRFDALCAVHNIVERTDSGRHLLQRQDVDISGLIEPRTDLPYDIVNTELLKKHARGTTVENSRLIDEGKISQLNTILVCELIVEANLRNAASVELFDSGATVANDELFLALYRARTTLQGDQSTALEALGVLDAGQEQVIRQLGDPDPIVRMHAASAISAETIANHGPEICRQFDDPHEGVRRILCTQLSDGEISSLGNDTVDGLVGRLIDNMDDPVPAHENLRAHISLLTNLVIDRTGICRPHLRNDISAAWIRRVLIQNQPEDANIQKATLAMRLASAYIDTKEGASESVESALFDLFEHILENTSPDEIARADVFKGLYLYVSEEWQRSTPLAPFLQDAIASAENGTQKVHNMGHAFEVGTQVQATRVLILYALLEEEQALHPTIFSAYINAGRAYRSAKKGVMRNDDDEDVQKVVSVFLADINDTMKKLTAHYAGTDVSAFPEGIIEALKMFTEDSDPDVAKTALWAYAELAGQTSDESLRESVIEHLGTFQENPDRPTPVRMTASDALEQLNAS